MKTNGEMVVCPGSRRSLDFDKDQPHFCKPAELAANKGLCRQCRARIQRQHAAIRHGKPESPVSMSRPHRHDSDPETDHLAFAANGAHEQSVNFDFDTVAAGLAEFDGAPADVQVTALELAAELLARIFSFCWLEHRKGAASKEIIVPLVPIRTATLRFAAVVGGIRPDLVARTFKEIGAECGGRTKAAVSRIALEFADSWGVKLARCRNVEERDHMRQAMTKSHAQRKATP